VESVFRVHTGVVEEAIDGVTDYGSKSGTKNDKEDHEGSVELTSIIKCTHIVNSMVDKYK
jgi:hypothetical protein